MVFEKKNFTGGVCLTGVFGIKFKVNGGSTPATICFFPPPPVQNKQTALKEENVAKDSTADISLTYVCFVCIFVFQL